ncbi:MAG: amidohydrolase, partial [Proteobacteria bacterium]|nr:amidohydrolase [Pseudomonadota bacterium]
MSFLRSIILSFIILFPFSIFAKSPDILIKNATVVTSTEIGVLDETDVLIQNGKISLIGENINNDEAMIIEAKGRVLTPGLIAPVTNLGLIEIELEAETRDDRTDHFSAGFSISSAFNPSSTLIPYNRAS